jgi:hypothetical protein
MGQRADQVDPAYNDRTGSGADNGGENKDPDEIRAEIEQTRAEMSGTIDAIQEKLNPDNLKEQAKEMVREATIGRVEDMADQVGQTAKGYGSGLIDTIKENPFPAALAGIGLGWLFMSGRKKSQDYANYRGRSYYYDAPIGGNPRYSGFSDYSDRDWRYYENRQQESGLTDKVADTARTARDRVGDVAGGAAEQVGDMARGARDQVGAVAGGVQQSVGEAGDWFDDTLRQNPLVVGAAAVVLGAAIGMMVPETRQEHQMLGQARDNLMEKAGEAVQQTMGKVQRVAQEAGSAARQEAEEQGLAGSQSQGQSAAQM